MNTSEFVCFFGGFFVVVFSKIFSEDIFIHTALIHAPFKLNIHVRACTFFPVNDFMSCTWWMHSWQQPLTTTHYNDVVSAST